MKVIIVEGTPKEISQFLSQDGQTAALTNREVEIARLICQRLTTEAIAKVLCIEAPTVKKHRSRIRQKLGVSDWKGLEDIREQWDTS